MYCEYEFADVSYFRYFEGAVPIVEELVGNAGARLGAWLSAIHVSVTSNVAGKVNDDQQQIFAGVREEV